MSPEQKHDAVVGLANATPPVAVTAATHFLGLPLSEWVMIGTLLLILIQVCYYLWKWRSEARRDDDERRERMSRRRESGKARLAVTALTLSAAGLIGIAVHEGYTDRAIIPTKGDVPTYGFGTTTRPDGSPVRMGDQTNPVQALQFKARDLTRFEGALKECVRVPLYQAEYDVYVDMAYNIGSSAFCGSTMVRRLNAEDYRGACDAILMWKRVGAQDCSVPGNRVCWGLWERRLQAHAKCMGAQNG